MKVFSTLYKNMSQISTLLKSLLEVSEKQKSSENSQSPPTKLLKAEQNYLKFSNSYKNSKMPTTSPKLEKTSQYSLPTTWPPLHQQVSKSQGLNFDWDCFDDLWAVYAKGTSGSYSLGQKQVKQPSLPAKSPTSSTKFLNRIL